MENKPTFDRGLIPPIILSVFSLFGICLVFLVVKLYPLRTAMPIENTSVPFQYLLTSTESGFASLTPKQKPAATTTSDDDVVSLASPTRTRLPINTSASTPTTASTAPLNPGVYDDTDERIIYSGDWTQTKTNNVTLHVSNTLNNTATIRFIGEQIRIFYQSSSSLGTIRINIDGLEIDLNESADVVAQSEWVSPTLINGTHTVTITHVSGGSVNLDAFAIPDPIRTATPTP
ncbi:MAG: hypothetical protein B6D38_00165 [Anaerolineae bacterium UTCFX1]|jgi:hypothetical protein|nr:MAG: hypothetical protein B6D38_00165 [Anaerolineae bacterium UTCFX1]